MEGLSVGLETSPGSDFGSKSLVYLRLLQGKNIPKGSGLMASRSPRRFKAEPAETSVTSSRHASKETPDAAAKPAGRLAPEPIEESVRSSRRSAQDDTETTPSSTWLRPTSEQPVKLKRRFLPQPIETSARSSRRNDVEEDPATRKPTRRKFAPQVVETVKRSRRAGDTMPALLPSDKTEVTPGDPKNLTKQPRRLPDSDHDENDATLRVTSRDGALLRSRTQMGRASSRGSKARQHSFRVPSLDAIESSDSDDSETPSLATSPSTASSPASYSKHVAQLRRGVEEKVSGYLAHLAQQSAEEQLRDQALAAFPNTDHHEPVDHFIDRDSDDESLIAIERNESGSEVNWELRAMLLHQDKLRKARTERVYPGPYERARSRCSTDSGPYGDPTAGYFPPASPLSTTTRGLAGGWHRTSVLHQMRNAASPPMLGGDIVFPRSNSPDPANLDTSESSVTTKPPPSTLPGQPGAGGLWVGPHISSRESSTNSNTGYPGGLWAGLCDLKTQTSNQTQTGLMTPGLTNPSHQHASNHDANDNLVSTRQLPSFPPPPITTLSIDAKLAAAKAIDDEFPDRLVTQVYNYLSLGYSALGRKFDHELSKISGIPVEELRRDDDDAARSRGYILLDEGEHEEDRQEGCARWKALRLYIREWARQQPLMVAVHVGGTAVGVRKGSWAL